MSNQTKQLIHSINQIAKKKYQNNIWRNIDNVNLLRNWKQKNNPTNMGWTKANTFGVSTQQYLPALERLIEPDEEPTDGENW